MQDIEILLDTAHTEEVILHDKVLVVDYQHYDWNKCKNPWLIANVKLRLYPFSIPFMQVSESDLGSIFLKWMLSLGITKPRLVGYYAGYNHVCLAQRFGEMINLPEELPMWSCDLQQWRNDLDNPTLPPPNENEHNALFDARWIRDSYNWLVGNYDHPAWTPELRKPRAKVA